MDTISIPNVVDPGVRKHFVDGYTQLKPQIDKVFKIDKQESETDEYKNYTGLSSYTQVNQGGEYDEDNPIQSYGVNLTPVKFGKMVPVTYEMRKWAKTKEIWDASSMLGKAAARHVDQRGADVFNNGRSASYTSYSDAKPLFSTIHPRSDGGATQSNLSTTGIEFTEPNLEVGLLAVEYQLDDRGNLIDLMASKLIIPSALRREACVILKSDKKSGTGDNDVNPYGIQEFYGVMKILVWKRLSAAAGGSDTAWTLQGSNHGLKWQWAEKPQVFRDESVGFKTDTVYYKGRYYASNGWRDWRDMWNSAGDKADIST